MFSEESDDLKVKLLDYQLMEINHPAYDIFYLLYIGTDSEFRKKYFKGKSKGLNPKIT